MRLMNMRRAKGTAAAIEVPQIPEPCAESWESMAGDARVRHCPVCAKDVHNLAAMPAAEIARLLHGPGPVPCVRISRDVEGRLMTTEPTQAAWRGVAAMASGWVAMISAAVTVSPLAAQTMGELTGRVAPRHATASLTGKLVDEAGRPFGDATVRLLDHGAPRGLVVQAAPDGTFALEAKPGRYSLLIEGARVVTKTVAVTLAKGKTSLPDSVPVHVVAPEPRSTAIMGAPPAVPQITAGKPVTPQRTTGKIAPPVSTTGIVQPRRPAPAGKAASQAPAQSPPAAANAASPSCSAGTP